MKNFLIVLVALVIGALFVFGPIACGMKLGSAATNCVVNEIPVGRFYNYCPGNSHMTGVYSYTVGQQVYTMADCARSIVTCVD